MVWNTECSPERGPEWAGMRLRRVWLENAQERPWKPGVLRPGSALLARERGLSGRASSVCCIEVCIGIVYWSCVRPGFACPDPSCVCGERYQPSCVCDGAVCADVRCVWSSTVFGRTKAGWQRWVVSIVGNVRSFHVNSNIHGANMGPTWGRKDPGGPHVGLLNLAISVAICLYNLDMKLELCDYYVPVSEHTL